MPPLGARWAERARLCYSRGVDEHARDREERADLPRLPLRASIYIDPDGSVQFGALFAELLPVAQALGALPEQRQTAPGTDARDRERGG
jgi:hypothetical protein